MLIHFCPLSPASFVSLFEWVFRLTRECFTRIETSLLPLKAANVDLYSALMTNEERGLLSVPLLLWHRASVNNGHLRGLVTLKPIVERFVVELSLPVFTTLVWCSWDSNTQPSAWGANTLTNCATAVARNSN